MQSKACVQDMVVGHKLVKHLVQSFARLLQSWGVSVAQWQWIEQPYGERKTQSRMLFSIGEFILVLQVLHFWSYFRFSFAILWKFYLWKRKKIVMGTTLFHFDFLERFVRSKEVYWVWSFFLLEMRVSFIFWKRELWFGITLLVVTHKCVWVPFTLKGDRFVIWHMLWDKHLKFLSWAKT